MATLVVVAALIRVFPDPGPGPGPLSEWPRKFPRLARSCVVCSAAAAAYKYYNYQKVQPAASSAPPSTGERRRAIVIELINTPQNAAGDARGHGAWGMGVWRQAAGI